mmetsp:Transcript_3944/g.10336  ORF Transcript_3944/g.10336 Transcript_3944/m.10336 type:complete len:367 (+) Transcript_3944:1102-2202(+)
MRQPVRPAHRVRGSGGRPGRPDHLLDAGGAVHLRDGPARRVGPAGDRDLLLQRPGRLEEGPAGPVGPDGAHADAPVQQVRRPVPEGRHVLGHRLQAEVAAGPADQRQDRRPRAVDREAPGAEPGPVPGDPPEHAGPSEVPERPEGQAGQVPGDPPGRGSRPRGGPPERRMDDVRVRSWHEGGAARRGRAREADPRIPLVVPELVEGPGVMRRGFRQAARAEKERAHEAAIRWSGTERNAGVFRQARKRPTPRASHGSTFRIRRMSSVRRDRSFAIRSLLESAKHPAEKKKRLCDVAIRHAIEASFGGFERKRDDEAKTPGGSCLRGPPSIAETRSASSAPRSREKSREPPRSKALPKKNAFSIRLN